MGSLGGESGGYIDKVPIGIFIPLFFVAVYASEWTCWVNSSGTLRGVGDKYIQNFISFHRLRICCLYDSSKSCDHNHRIGHEGPELFSNDNQ